VPRYPSRIRRSVLRGNLPAMYEKVRIGRTLQSFPPSKRRGRLSTHAAVQRDGLRPLFFTVTLLKPWGRLSLIRLPIVNVPQVRVSEVVSVHHAWRTFIVSRPLQPGLWLLRRLRPPSRTLALSCPPRQVKRYGSSPVPAQQTRATRSDLLYAGWIGDNACQCSDLTGPPPCHFGSGV
jgi:hypothetical protein